MVLDTINPAPTQQDCVQFYRIEYPLLMLIVPIKTTTQYSTCHVGLLSTHQMLQHTKPVQSQHPISQQIIKTIYKAQQDLGCVYALPKQPRGPQQYSELELSQLALMPSEVLCTKATRPIARGACGTFLLSAKELFQAEHKHSFSSTQQFREK